MKRNHLLWLILGLALGTGFAQDWPTAELNDFEQRLQDLKAQIDTLDEYAPKKFPEFEDLERTNQLVERIDFNERKFKMLIDRYNLVEDRVFPHILELSTRRPALRPRLLKKLGEYRESSDLSILSIQKEINTVALLIDRLEKELDRLQVISQAKALEGTAREGQGTEAQTQPLSERIQSLAEIQTAKEKELVVEGERLEKLRQRAREEEDKIKEKREEIVSLRRRSETSDNPVERAVDGILAEVRGIRLNGLEIPRWNTTKAFIFLSKTKSDTLKGRITQIEDQMQSLKRQRRQELQKTFLKGLMVILVAILMVLMLMRISRRIGRRIIRRVEESESLDPHRKQRYNTLFSIILSMIKITLWILAVLWVLGELQIDYAPFLVAAGGISLAIGFGAQSLVKDVVSGFFILMEEQLALNDVVEIDGKTGSVEHISLRTVRLRSLDGTLHIIPNGNIAKVSNLTHKWSRAISEVGVSYDADPERVISVLKSVCETIYADETWKPSLLEEPLPQGILSFGDSALDFRILAKTVPGEQWAVDREMKIRVKKAFDAANIEIPYPFRNVVDRTPVGPDAAPADRDASVVKKGV